MSATCQAYAHRYVGKGKDRVLYEGNCVLERGHDLDHLPASLAAQSQYIAAFNAGVDAALEAAVEVLKGLNEGDQLQVEDVTLHVSKIKR